MADFFVFTGNCQAQFFAAVFDGLDDTSAVYEGIGFGFVPNYGYTLAVTLQGEALRAAVDAARARGDRIILAQQATDVAQLTESEYAPDFSCSFPFVTCHAISPPEFAVFYGIDSPPAPHRISDFDLGAMTKSQAKSAFPVDVVSFIRDQFKTRMLFNSTTHPSGPVNGLIIAGILEQLAGFDPKYGELDLVPAVSRHEGINFMTSLPLAAEVVEDLGLAWDDGASNLSELIVLARRDGAFSDAEAARFEAAAATYADNTQFWLAAERVHAVRGDFPKRLQALEAVVRLSPGYHSFWNTLAEAYLSAGDRQAAEGVLARADAQYGSRWEKNNVVSRLYQTLGRYDDALAASVQYLHDSNYFLHAIIPICEALVALDRRDEIQGYAQLIYDVHPYHTDQVKAWVAAYGG